MIEITLLNGQRIIIWQDIAGLHCKTKHPKANISLVDIIPLMDPKDQRNIIEWCKDISGWNGTNITV